MNVKHKLAFPQRYNRDTDFIFNICNDVSSKFTIFKQPLLSHEQKREMSRNELNSYLTVFHEEQRYCSQTIDASEVPPFGDMTGYRVPKKRYRPVMPQFSGVRQRCVATEQPKRLDFSRGARRYVDRSPKWQSLYAVIFEGLK